MNKHTHHNGPHPASKLPFEVGIGLKPQYYDAVLDVDSPIPPPDWLEVHPQNYFGVGAELGAVDVSQRRVVGEAEGGLTHDLLAVVEGRRTEVATDLGVAALGPRRVAEQHIDLTVSEGGEALGCRQADELELGRVTEDGRGNSPAVVSVEAIEGSVVLGLGETDGVGGHTTTQASPGNYLGQRAAGLATRRCRGRGGIVGSRRSRRILRATATCGRDQRQYGDDYGKSLNHDWEIPSRLHMDLCQSAQGTTRS